MSLKCTLCVREQRVFAEQKREKRSWISRLKSNPDFVKKKKFLNNL